MSRRDEAVEAARLAIHQALASDWMSVVKALDGSQEQYEALLADIANAALTAALAVLHPTVPNSVEALDTLPRGTVLRGEDHEGTPWLASLTPAFDSAQSVPCWRDMGIDSWQVLWTPEQDQFTTKETK